MKQFLAGENIKLIFAGLDKAGKTTIHKHVLEEMGLEQLEDLKATRGIERHTHDFLDQDFAVWDLGGQLSYRQTYLSKPEVFNMTKALIFVVDIQDMERLEESYQYYVDILNILVNVEKKPKLYVLFHKFDPDLRGKLRNNFYKASRMFRNADNIIDAKFKGYATSIYSNGTELAVKRILFDNFEEFKEKPTGAVRATASKPTESKEIPQTPQIVPKTPAKPTSSDPSIPTTRAPVPSSKLNTPVTSAPVPSIKTSAPTPSIKSSAPVTSAPSPSIKPSAPVTGTSQPTTSTSQRPKATTITGLPPPETTTTPQAEMVKNELDEATPKFFDDVSDEVVKRLTNIINKRMKETPEVVALSILASDGKQVLGIGKNEIDYERLEKLRSVVGSLNPKAFFKDLSDIEYRGLGHFSLEEFDIYFARASEDYAIAILAVDVSTLMLQNAQRIVKSIRQALSLTGDDDIEDEDTPKTKKKDLVGDLRSRLRNLSGFDEV